MISLSRVLLILRCQLFLWMYIYTQHAEGEVQQKIVMGDNETTV